MGHYEFMNDAGDGIVLFYSVYTEDDVKSRKRQTIQKAT